MYSGENPTAIRSQEWLCDALIALMRGKPYSSITVMDICRKADLSRQTFYNFFESKDEVLRFLLQRQYMEQFNGLRELDKISMSDAVNAFADLLVKNRDVFVLMLQNRLDGIITSEIGACVALFADRFSVRARDECREYGEAFLCGALAQTMLCWFRSEKPIDIDELCNLLLSILHGKYYEIV